MKGETYNEEKTIISIAGTMHADDLSAYDGVCGRY